MASCIPLVLVICFMAAAMTMVPTAQAQTGLFSQIRINGTVLCTVNVTLNPTAPPFPNATVQLKCNGIMVGSNVTNSAGNFQINLAATQNNLASIIFGSCTVVVTTPLATCNATLPSAGGILTSTLQIVGTASTVFGTVLNLIARAF